MKKKEKASAMVLAVLILAFFMTLSLNMYFLAEKKAQRAGLKSKGTTILADIDSSSTLGYYELYLAGEFLTKGMVTTSNASIYSSPSTFVGTSIAGITIEGYTEYFTKYVNGKIDDNGNGIKNVTGNAVLLTESGIGSGKDRVWNILNDNYKEIWESNNEKSIGGYKLKKLNSIVPLPTDKTIFIDKIFGGSPTIGQEEKVKSIYEKEIEFDGEGSSFPESKFKIEVTRESTVEYIAPNDYELKTDELTTIEVIKEN